MTDGIESLGAIRKQGLVLLGVVFVAGGLAGGAIDRVYVTRYQESVVAWRAREEAEDYREWALRGHREREDNKAEAERHAGEASEGVEIPLQVEWLGLTNEQRVRIRAIIAHARPRADSIMHLVRPRVRELELSMYQEIMCVLSPPQRAEWVSWREREGSSSAETQAWLARAYANECPS
jgi:hypothetical protein